MNRTAIALSAGFVALGLAASLFLERELWGVSAWGAVSWIVALAAAAVVVPQLFRAAPVDPLRRIPPARRRVLRIAAVAAISIACFRLLGARHDLWGERGTLAAALERGRWLPAGPLASALHGAVYRFMNAVFLWNATETISLLAALFGALYVFAAMRAAGLVFHEEREREARPLAASALVAGGFAVTFLGGGNAAAATFFVLAFLSSALEFARGGRSIALPAALFAAAILSHASALYLLPAFAYACFTALGAPSARRRLLAALALPIAAWALFEIAGASMGYATPARFIVSYAARGVEDLARGGLASLGAAGLGALNALLIVGPASVAAIAFLARPERPARPVEAEGRDRERRFLALAAGGGIVLVAVSAAGVDGGLRWHAVASAGPAFALFALWSIRRRASSALDARRAVSALVLAGLFHTVPLVLLCDVQSFAERRLRTLPLHAGRAEAILGARAEDAGDRAAAKRWYEASIALDPSNASVESRLGDIAMKEWEYPSAITHYLNAHEIAPADPRRRFDLAEALIENRWFPEAIAHLETLVAAYPESVSYWRRLGFARNNGNRYEDAVAAYERALSLEPSIEQNARNLASALLNRAAELQVDKRYDEARLLYARVIGMFPDDWRACNNLALMEIDIGNYAEAEKMLERALVLHWYEPNLHTSMGLALEKQGRLREALEYLRKGAEFDPLYSSAPRHIERVQRALGTADTAQSDSQRSPLRSP